ncbi:M3 family oligoendopeptidase [Siphonobacter sp. SORGH_AS_1065]|uniref:M3 family oligoendopeptidase n=1 Tax=Siphonobacter sp. SORGH_AS_1065 TaxID=3041795 RepID=UPI00277FED1E|nr:M3 family oligoendopeptidase [Siphonobacter sp. SORGH_AS_1065]MDQ1087704.1 oligoendopeptidase F [Siphonobacter sp. SORGH_AS_1065]
MIESLPQRERAFLPAAYELTDWTSVQPYFDELKDRIVLNADELRTWFQDRSELESYLSENFAWRYIRMTTDTSNEAYVSAFHEFNENIQPHWAEISNVLDQKALASPYVDDLKDEGYFITLRAMRRQIEIFRTENVPLFTQIQQLQSQYGNIAGAMTVTLNGEEMTLQKAGDFLMQPDRAVREEAWRTIWERRYQDHEALDDLLNQLRDLRHQVAQNAGFANFRDYMFAAMGRFDYTVEDCFNFHDAIAQTVVPVLNELSAERKQALQTTDLRPWDKLVDPTGQAPLKPFAGGEDLLTKTIEVFDRLDPELGSYLRVMRTMGRFDLESRKGKAPGGYNYPLEESGVPFIFMNATSNLRDMVTILHEGGHAVHSIVTRDLALNSFRNVPSEVAELASMSMELITMDHWDVFFPNPEDLRRAKLEHLEDIIETLPWVATVDAFQHWLYENPTHSIDERNEAWLQIFGRFSDTITDWSGLERFKAYQWQRQLHIYEVPFYYIEYGIAQLGAIGVWKNYKEDPKKGLEGYLNALKLGYTCPMGEIYAAANIPFDFSKEHIASLMNFVRTEIEKLK